MEVATIDNRNSDNSQENEALILARIYALVIQSHASKKAACASRPDDAKGSLDDRATDKYTG